MSSIRKLLSSRANGAKSPGPSTPEAKQRSSANSLRHGLLARCVVLENESRETFDTLLGQHLDRFQPVDGVEFGMIEEMVASYWRLRRAWAIETRMLDNEINQPAAPPTPQTGPHTPSPGPANPELANRELDQIAGAFTALAEKPSLALMHRYETRLHLMYQRALHNLLLLRNLDPPNLGIPNDPSPISEHSALPGDTAQPCHLRQEAGPSAQRGAMPPCQGLVIDAPLDVA